MRGEANLRGASPFGCGEEDHRTGHKRWQWWAERQWRGVARSRRERVVGVADSSAKAK